MFADTGWLNMSFMPPEIRAVLSSQMLLNIIWLLCYVPLLLGIPSMLITARQRQRSYGWPLCIQTLNCGAAIPLLISHLLRPMSLLQTLWKHGKQSYPLTSKAFLATFLFTPNIPDSLTLQMFHFCREKALYHFGQIVDARTRIWSSFQEAFDLFKLFTITPLCTIPNKLPPICQAEGMQKNMLRGTDLPNF